MAEREDIQTLIQVGDTVTDDINQKLKLYARFHRGLNLLMLMATDQGFGDLATALGHVDTDEENQKTHTLELIQRISNAKAEAGYILNSTAFPVVPPVDVSQEVYDQYQSILADIQLAGGEMNPIPEAISGILKVGVLQPK